MGPLLRGGYTIFIVQVLLVTLTGYNVFSVQSTLRNLFTQWMENGKNNNDNAVADSDGISDDDNDGRTTMTETRTAVAAATTAAARLEATSSNKTKTEQQHQPPPALLPQPGSCSCWNASHTCQQSGLDFYCYKRFKSCCYRTWHVDHKMGYVLSRNLVRTSQTGIRIESYGLPRRGKERPAAYFRHPVEKFQHREVVLTRNVLDAVVSGFLYHQGGHECTRDLYGNNLVAYTAKYNATESNWARNLWWWQGDDSVPWNKTSPAKTFAGMDMCRYLADTSVSQRERLTAYADYALGFWYLKMYRYHQQIKQYEDPKQPTALFICYHDLVHPETKMATIRKAMEWLFPGGGYNNDGRYYASDKLAEQSSSTTTTRRRKTTASSGGGVYRGKHSTDRNPALRRTLKRTAEELDRTVFQNFIAKANRALGCRSTI